MAKDIPASDAEFNAWLGSFVTCAGAKPANLGLVTFITLAMPVGTRPR